MENIASVEKTGVIFKEIPTSVLKAGRYQPRKIFPEDGLKSLAETMKRVGVLEPLLVRNSYDGAYEIIAGERRWRAAEIAGLKTVPCLVGHYNDKRASEIALIENLNRENLNPIDEALAVSNIIAEFKYTHEEMGAILGRTRSHITNLLRLLKLDRRVQENLRKGELSEAHGKILAGISFEKQKVFAELCIKHQWSMRALSKAIKPEAKNKKIEEERVLKKDVNILRLEKELSDQMGHIVKLFFDKDKKGQINIHFTNLDEFDTILYKFKKLFAKDVQDDFD